MNTYLVQTYVKQRDRETFVMDIWIESSTDQATSARFVDLREIDLDYVTDTIL